MVNFIFQFHFSYFSGIGVLITSSLIKKSNPTVIVQIESEHKTRNFPSSLTSEFVEKNILNLSRSDSDPKTLDYKLILTKSAVVNVKKNLSKKEIKKRQADNWYVVLFF